MIQEITNEEFTKLKDLLRELISFDAISNFKIKNQRIYRGKDFYTNIILYIKCYSFEFVEDIEKSIKEAVNNKSIIICFS